MTQFQRLVVNPEQIENQQIALTDSQQHYLRRVLRLQAGDRFIAVDGIAGYWLLSELATDSEKAVVIEVLDGQTELPVSVVLITAMPKQGMDDIVRQSTELGVTAIQPVYGDRTILKPSPQKVVRWQRIAQEASEQSERRFVPTVYSPCSLAESLAYWQLTTQQPETRQPKMQQEKNEWVTVRACYICTARHDAPHFLHALHQWMSPASINDRDTLQELVVAVGPEGGWTPKEIEQAIAHGYQPILLGKRILRAVTAPIVALSLIASVIEQGQSL